MYPGGAWAHQLCQTTNAFWISAWIRLLCGSRSSLLVLRKGLEKRTGPTSWGWSVSPLLYPPVLGALGHAMPGLTQGLRERILHRIFSQPGEVRRSKRDPKYPSSGLVEESRVHMKWAFHWGFRNRKGCITAEMAELELLGEHLLLNFLASLDLISQP